MKEAERVILIAEEGDRFRPKMLTPDEAVALSYRILKEAVNDPRFIEVWAQRAAQSDPFILEDRDVEDVGFWSVALRLVFEGPPPTLPMPEAKDLS